MNQKQYKILTINLSIEISKRILKECTTQNITVKIADNLESTDISNNISDYQLVVIDTVNDQYTPTHLEKFCISNPNTEFMVVNNSKTYSDSDYLHARIFDTLTENISDDELHERINRALNNQNNKSKLLVLKQQVAMCFGYDNLIGSSKPMRKLKESIRNIAPTDINVILSGPSGSGKALTAMIIHHHSERRKNNCVTLDCSSIPEILFDETVFGKSDRNNDFGLIGKADKGTLYIKDVEKIPMSIQQKLLNFMQTYTITKVESNLSKKIDTRIITSTSTKLKKQIENGFVIEELSHLLGEITISISALTERIDDIEELIEYFSRKISFETNHPTFTYSRGALELLFHHNWIGNIRELDNTIKRATTLCRNGHIEESDILFIESGKMTQSTPRIQVNNSESSNGLLDEGQRTLIIKTLNDNSWNFTQTAQELGIGRTTLWRKVKKYNLKKEETELV